MWYSPVSPTRDTAAIPPDKIEDQQPRLNSFAKSGEPIPLLNFQTMVRANKSFSIAVFLPAALRVNDEKVIGSLSFNPGKLYSIGVRIDRGGLRLGFFRKISGHKTYRSSFVAYLPGELAPAAGTGSGATVSELEIQAFRFEVLNESGYLEDDTTTALKTTEARVATDVLVQMTVLCARHGLPEEMKGPEWKTMDADVWRNLDEMAHENYVLTIWCLVNRLLEKVQILASFESSVEDHVHRMRNVSKPASRLLRALRVFSAKAVVQFSKDTLSETATRSATPTSLVGGRRSMEGAEARGPEGVPSPAEQPPIEATTSTGQSASNVELQAKIQKLEEEIERLHLADQLHHATIQQKIEDWQRLKEKANQNFNDFRRKTASHTKEQAEEIKQLRDVGKFWLGLEQLRHRKITQFFTGTLPEDDIVFQLAEKGFPEA